MSNPAAASETAAELPSPPSPSRQSPSQEIASSSENFDRLTRTPTVRFSNESVDEGRSTMSEPRADGPSSSEVTPIRQASHDGSRNYSTSGTLTQNTSSETPREEGNTKPKAAPPPPQHPADLTAPKSENKTPWFKKVADKYGSVTLENKGSVARDHLALERTFLAWLRTSLSFASIGIAITQLFRLNTSLATRKRALHPFAAEYESSQVPFSPLLGHAIPHELYPYIQQLVTPSLAAMPVPELGPTLLDQLLLLPAQNPSPISTPHFLPDKRDSFDEHSERLRHVGKPLGATFIGVSVLILLIGFHRYFESQYWIMKGKFPASRGSVAMTCFVAGALIIASLTVVIVIAPSNFGT